MKNTNEIKITTHDRLLRGWQNSIDLVLAFEECSNEIKDDSEVAKVFAKFAEDEGMHAAKFREILLDYQNGKVK